MVERDARGRFRKVTPATIAPRINRVKVATLKERRQLAASRGYRGPLTARSCHDH
jgi:hypothetical protein